jgi:O-antigen/teichoic acid export membrane protein
MSIGKHSAMNLTTSVASLAVALVTVPIYLKLIGPESYGMLAVLWALLGYFGFMDLGLGRAVQQRLASNSGMTQAWQGSLIWTALFATLLLGVFGGAAIAVLGETLLVKFVSVSSAERQESIQAIFWLSSLFPILLSNSVLSGALLARLKYVKTNQVQFFTNALGQIVPLIVAANGHTNIDALVAATLIVRSLGTAVLFIFVWKEMRLKESRRIQSSHLKFMFNYGGWLSILSILAPALVTIDRIIIGSIAGAQAVAYYIVPYNLVFRTMVIPTSLSNAIFPRIARIDDDRGRALASKATCTLVAVMTLVAITGILLAQPFLQLWIGYEFSIKADGVAEIIMIGIWINSLVVAHHSRYMATNSPKAIVYIFLLEIPVYMLCLYMGLNFLGVLGAAIAWTLRVLLDTILLLRLNSELIATAKIAASSVVLVGVSYVSSLASMSYIELGIVCLSLLIASAYKDRAVLTEIFAKLRSKS